MNRQFMPSIQEQRVLNYLKDHDGMTTLDAYAEKICSPAKCIEVLRNAGYKIETKYKHTETGKRYGVYVLHKGGEKDVEQTY